MELRDLKQSIESRQAKIAVIGLGYVGLPVAAMFAESGFDVLGIDVKEERVAQINQGISPIEGDEPGLEDLIAGVVQQKRLKASSDYSLLADRDIILIDVETPVDENNIPRYEALKAALTSLAQVMKNGSLVIVESTIAPGTMRDVVKPLLEKNSAKQLNRDFYLGNCPERVMPGKLLTNLKNLSRVVGGATPETSDVMAVLYACIVHAELDPADWITAELVKTTENAYRDVQIAFANEVALISQALGGDAWKVRELVNKSPYRSMHLPGAGVGGHCIPKDPWLLAYGVHDLGVPLRLIPAARAVNDSMPLHVFALLEDALQEAGLTMNDVNVLVMGYAYLEDSDDIRNSPSKVLVEVLKQAGAHVQIHDPFVPGYQTDLVECLPAADAAVIMVAHSDYKNLDIAFLKENLRSGILVDGRRVFDPTIAKDVGLIFRSIGWGK